MALFDTKFEKGRQDWETPESIFSPLNDEFGFTLDVCASVLNKKCKLFYSIEDDGFNKEWVGSCWMNPPFGEQGKWVKKAYDESKKDNCLVVALLPARTNTVWWHKYCKDAEVRFILGRPKFVGAKYGLPQPLSIVIFGGESKTHFKTFELLKE